MINLNSQRVLITGAAGFIGANLTRKMVELGGRVTALFRPGGNLVRIEELLPLLELLPVDLNHFDELHKNIQKIQPEIILNLATPAGHPPTRAARLQLLKTSVIGTANLLETLATIDFEHFIHFGSSTEYGPRDVPLKESHRLEPNTFRGVTKAAAALLCQQFAHSYNRPVTIIRPFSVYGYWEAPTRLIPTVIRAALQGYDLDLTDPGFVRDPIFVEDLVQAGILALDLPDNRGQIINVGSGQQWSNEAIVETIQEISGRKILIHSGAYSPSPSDTHHWVADISVAKELLGWQPRHSLQSGLEKTISWFRPRLALYDAWRSTTQPS
jgi:nucleoside-diphosphate-sugar epimerase